MAVYQQDKIINGLNVVALLRPLQIFVRIEELQ